MKSIIAFFIISLSFCLPDYVSSFVISNQESNTPPFTILRSRNYGMFSIFGDVLCLCKFYEKGDYQGIEVDFLDEGLYYDAEKGMNWWTYYCEPISYGKKNKSDNIKVIQGYPYDNINITENETTVREANALIQKYIHIRPEIQKEVDDFVRENFVNNYVIGVHYRGTDKYIEAVRVNYDDVRQRIQKIMDENANEPIKIFIATDEDAFIQYMKEAFGKSICYNKNVARSSSKKPIHTTHKNPYQSGKEALVDCLLLSRGSILIRTSSNLSLWSTFFNPDIPVIELSVRKGHKNPLRPHIINSP